MQYNILIYASIDWMERVCNVCSVIVYCNEMLIIMCIASVRNLERITHYIHTITHTGDKYVRSPKNVEANVIYNLNRIQIN